MGGHSWPTGFVLFFRLFDCFEIKYSVEDFSDPRWIRPPAPVRFLGEGAIRDTSRDALRALSSPSTCVASRKFLARRLPRAPRPRHWRPRAAPRWRSRRCVSPRHQHPNPWNPLCPPGDVFSGPAPVSAARLGALPASIARNSRPIVAASVPVAFASERGAARVPRTRILPAGRPASLGQRSLQEGRPRSHVRGDDRVASRPRRARAGPSRRAFSLPRSPPRYARETGADRDSRTPFARGGIPSRPLNGLPSRASPRSAHIFSPVLVCPNPRLTDAPIDPPYQPAGPWFRHFPRRRYPRARYRARHRSRAQGARGARGGEGFLRPLRLPQAGASLAARPDRRQITPHTARRTRFEP